VRRWSLGLAPNTPGPVGGRPARYWLDLFALTHRATPHGWVRLEWPDGRPALEQPWPRAKIFHTIGEELARVLGERRRRTGG